METLMTLLAAAAGVILGGVLTWVIGKLQQTQLIRKLRNLWANAREIGLNEELLMTELLAEKIQQADFHPDVIIAVSPGGEMIAEWLSRRFLGNALHPIPVRVIWVNTKRKEGALIVEHAAVDDGSPGCIVGLDRTSNVLLVTDICRGGQTFLAACEFLEKELCEANIQTAALLRHGISRVEPLYTVSTTDQDVHFEWKAPPSGTKLDEHTGRSLAGRGAQPIEEPPLSIDNSKKDESK